MEIKTKESLDSAAVRERQKVKAVFVKEGNKSKAGKGTEEKKVIAVMPAFNAEKTLYKTYQAIPKDCVHEVIMVDDASEDNTVQKAREIEGLIVVVHQENKGYGGNQKTCYRKALGKGADIVVMIHPDFQYDPGRVPDLIGPIKKNEADLVLGSRFLEGDPREKGMVWWRYWGNRLLTSMQNNFLNIELSEGHSGYRAYSRDLLEKISFDNFSDDFVFDSQMLAAAAREGFKLAEVPIPTRYTQESSSISFAASVKYGLATVGSLINK